MNFQERYRAHPVGVDQTVTLTGSSIGGFLPLTAGTVTVTNLAGVVLLNAYPVTAGVYAKLPIFLNTIGGTFTCAGGASGTLLV